MLLLRLLAERDMYGYQMIEELAQRSNDTFALKAGTLYPILHALEADGSIESYEQPGGAATAQAAALLPYHQGRAWCAGGAANGVAPGVPGDQRCVGNNGARAGVVL